MAQRPHRRDDHDDVRPQAADAADDVHELLHPEVGGEARLGDHELAELERDPVGDDRVVAVGDVRERARVHEAELALERLDDVRLERVLEQHRHRAGRLDLLGRDRVAGGRVADRDRAELAAQVGQVGREREDRHHLARGRDVEARLGRDAVLGAAEPADDVAQLPVGDVDRPPPRDRRDLRLVAMEPVRVDERREQVVRRRDRVHVAGEVEVDVLHRHDLRVAAARRAALDPEHRPERRLPQRENRAPADLAEPLRQRDRGRRLPLARRRRRDRRHVDELRVGHVGEPVEDREVDLRLVAAVELELVRLDPGLGRDVGDGAHDGRLRDFEAGEHVGIPFVVSRQWLTAAAASSETRLSL